MRRNPGRLRLISVARKVLADGFGAWIAAHPDYRQLYLPGLRPSPTRRVRGGSGRRVTGTCVSVL
jgi:hypothetical protein